MFGLFAFSGRATAFVGPALLATFTAFWVSAHWYVCNCRLHWHWFSDFVSGKWEKNRIVSAKKQWKLHELRA